MNPRVFVLTPDFLPEVFGGIGTYVSQLYSCSTSNECTIFFIPYGRTAVFPGNKMVVSLDLHSQISYYGDDPYVYWVKFNELVFDRISRFISDPNTIPDIIHVHGSYFALAAAGLKNKYGCKLLYVKHGVEFNRHDPDYLKDTTMLLIADKIVCPSKWTAKQILRTYPIPFDMPVVIPSGIDVKKVNVTNKSKKILFCGRGSKRKGCEIFVKAIDRLSGVLADTGYSARVIGNGPEEEAIHALIQEKQLGSLIRMDGYLSHDKALDAMAQAQVLVVPSCDEPFGLVALEGFSQGMCVIASNSGGLTEIVEDGETGVLFNSEDFLDLAGKLEYIITHPDVRLRLVENAQHALSYYSWQRVYREYSALNEMMKEN